MKLTTWLTLGGAAAGVYALRRALSGSQPASELGGGGENRPRVVVLGAGFGGLAAAGKLHQLAGERCEIVLLDRHNYHLFTPILYQVAACGVVPYDAAYPVRTFAAGHGVRFRQSTVTAVDFDRHLVRLEDGDERYDYLVLALGSTTDFFGNHSAREHALPLKWLEDGLAVRNHIIDLFEQAAKTDDDATRHALLTFAVVGGGATGVETAAALAGLIRQLPEQYPNLNRGLARVILVEGEGKLLGHMSARMAAIAQRTLSEIGVEIWLHTRAKDVEPDRLTTEDGKTVEARTVVWTTGVRAPEVVAALDAPHGKGGSVAVDVYLQVHGRPGVYALGDNAEVADAGSGKPIPLLAASALQEGHAVAQNIARVLTGQPQQPFHYRPLGNAVSLGHKQGVAQIGPVTLDGLAGWLAWRLVHLVRITSFRNRLATALDWSMAYNYQRDTARLEVQPIGHQEQPSANGRQATHPSPSTHP